MARVPVKFMEMHSSLFLMGKSFGGKIDPLMVQGLKVEYDNETDKIYVYYKDGVATLPMTSVMYFIEGEPGKRIMSDSMQTTGPRTMPSAQVSGPTSHVHAGPGAGKTGK